MSVVAESAGQSSEGHNSHHFNDQEWSLRVQLAAAYRLVDYFGWTELIYGHLTVRLPGEPATFLINPYGLNYDEVTASNLVRIDIDGNIVGDSNYPVNRAGFVIHSAVHMARSINKCVMHTHTRAGMAVSALRGGLQQVHMYSTGYYGRIAYHDYEGPSLDTDERERLLDDLGEKRADRDLAETVGETLERDCHIRLENLGAVDRGNDGIGRSICGFALLGQRRRGAGQNDGERQRRGKCADHAFSLLWGPGAGRASQLQGQSDAFPNRIQADPGAAGGGHTAT